MAEARAGRPRTRIRGLDALRGAALCGMGAYHLAWDLAALGWPVASPASSPGWTAFGDLVAGTFLFLSGVGLALARPNGTVFALRRLAVLAAAGLAVTGASLWFAPEAPILFGILQCIAASDALGLAALRLPGSARLALAALAGTAPALLASHRLDGWVGDALGLSAALPRALDYRPLLPWLAVVLVGTVAGDVLARRQAVGLRHPRPPSRVGRLLAGMGRHSLALYLLHQPVLYGALLLVRATVGQPAAEADVFGLQCQADCAAAGAAPRLCAAACACTARRLSADARTGAGGLTPAHLGQVGAECRRQGEGAPSRG